MGILILPPPPPRQPGTAESLSAPGGGEVARLECHLQQAAAVPPPMREEKVQAKTERSEGCDSKAGHLTSSRLEVAGKAHWKEKVYATFCR